jgi:lysophospholipase L1-like esterase
MKSVLLSFCLYFSAWQLGMADEPINGELAEKFHPVPPPKTSRLYLEKGDQLAICGDSITEQKMYSRIIEDYLTMCAPQLGVTVRQFGWSGERAPGFLARMTNDCLSFRPTIATTCYGMNDHEYRTYEPRIGETYRESSMAIIESFKAHGVRVVQGSPGCVGKVPGWTKTTTSTVDDLNSNLCTLRNIGIDLSQHEKVRFADVFWPMLNAGLQGRSRYGTNYAIAGKDGVHPGWAGHTVMAYAFLKALGLDGEIAKFTLDLSIGQITTSPGHEFTAGGNGQFVIRSERYPYCPCFSPGSNTTYPVCGKDDPSTDNSIRSAMALIPFNQELNRFMLIGKKPQAASYRITWGKETHTFSARDLQAGINLAVEFPNNPFTESFARVDVAVAAKEDFETRQIKQEFHSPAAQKDFREVYERTEKTHRALADSVHRAFLPVTHTLKVEAL